MEVKYEDETPWLFELGSFLSDRNLDTDDVTSIVLYIKNDPTDADGSALVDKSSTGGTITWTTDGDAVSVDINASDFGSGKMEIGGTYYVYMGFLATGYTGVMLEPVLKSHVVDVVQDGIRS